MPTTGLSWACTSPWSTREEITTHTAIQVIKEGLPVVRTLRWASSPAKMLKNITNSLRNLPTSPPPHRMW